MSRFTVQFGSFIGLMLAFAAAVAQENDNRGEQARLPYYSLAPSKLPWLLIRPGVQKELGLDETESQKLLASLREIDPTNAALQTPRERQQRAARQKAMMDETKQKSEEVIQRSLSEAQFQRYQQLELQRLGSRALVLPETAHKLAVTLGLTAEQVEKLNTISQNFWSEKPKEISEKFKSDLLAVLTPEQTNQWKTMTGAPFTAPKSFRGLPWQFVFVPEVRKELGLSEDDVATLEQSLEAVRKEVINQTGQEVFGLNRVGRPPAGLNRPVQQQIIDTVRSSLTVSRWNRLQELILQDAGSESLDHPDVATKVGLSREQRDRVRESMREFRWIDFDQRQPTKWDERQSRQQKLRADLLEILTSDQRKQWEAMQGEKVDPHLLASPGITAAGN